jgi:hypothetical protein
MEASSDRPAGEVLRAIGADAATLVRKEAELARQEIVEGVLAKLKGAAALIGALAIASVAMVFVGVAFGITLATALDDRLAWLVVAGVFGLLAGAALILGRALMGRTSMRPEKTLRTVKEDVEWARTQLTR